jgi:hypothetical protein
MKNKKYFFLCGIFTAALGTFLHFLFDLSGEAKIFALFSAVNESVFEHLKLLFWPFFITVIIGFFVLEHKKRIFLPAAIAVFSGMFFIASVHFTYKAFLGRSYSFIDISLFYVAVILSYLIFYILYKNGFGARSVGAFIGFSLFALIILAFIYFTINPPHTEAFLDPLTKTYGIN